MTCTPMELQPYGTGRPVFVIAERVVTFKQIDYNGQYGTLISLDDGSEVRCGHWPREVAEKINKAMKGSST